MFTGKPQARSRSFLAGGGEMGERMRAHNWSTTSLGSIEQWPQSLRSPLSMLLPSKAQIILFWGPELIVFYNDAYRPVFGAKHPRMLGEPGRVAWSEIWDTGAGLHALLDGVVRTGEAFHARDLLFNLERYGFVEETYFDVSYDPVRDESGNVGGVFCIVTETTGRVVGERRLALLRDLAERNATARNASDACRLAMETLARRPDVPFAVAYLGDTMAAATTGGEEARTATPSKDTKELAIPGGKLLLSLNPRQPFDEQYASFFDLVAGQIGTAINNANAYEEERRRADVLADLDRQKTAFFSNVSHEFRTPLTLMLGPLEELLAKEDESDSRELLGTVHRNGQRLLKLVNTLLDFARIEAGRIQASYEPTDLARLTSELASNFRGAYQNAGLALTVECPQLAEMAYVDREMWEKIVLNLISNAFKFTLTGGVEIRLADVGERLRLTVRDTGIGIPPQEVAQIFERFHRVEGARGRSQEGSGIGLALVHELVKLNGGTIGVESAAGQGSTFTVEIPKGCAHLPPEQIGHARDAASTTSRAYAYVSEVVSWLPGERALMPAPRVANAARVLVVDDNADLREYVRRLLAEYYDVQITASAREALEVARSRPPNLIVSDVMMPDLDGFGLIRELRADAVLHDTPVLLLSARAGEEARLEGIGQGADDYLAKPFSARELMVRVGALLQSAEHRRTVMEALRNSSAQFKTLLDQAPIGVYTVDANFRIQAVNPVARPVFGDIPGGIVGRDLDEILHMLWEQGHADEIVGIFRRTLDTGEPYVVSESAQIRVDRGTLEYHEWRIDRILQTDGQYGLVCYFRDISQQVLARKAIEESREALRAADARKDEFIATLAHELRNPLAALFNALYVSGHQGGGNATDIPAREIMERQLNHLTRLVDDLLEISRVTRGAFELRCERVELSTIVRNAIETTAPLIQGRRHTLEMTLPKEPLWLDGDPVRLVQILAALLNNAAKYTPDGGAIRVYLRREGMTALISVSDNGVGIDAAALGRIFEMFSRDAHADPRGQGGLGIGLTLARRLAEMHSGTVEGRSEGMGNGSEFIVRLPLASAPQSTAVSARQMVAPLGSSMRILVVDDNRDAAESMEMVLRTFGADVYVAHDGQEAVSMFDARHPQLVLLDIGLPGMDGYEVALALRAREIHTTLVAVTGWGQQEDRRRSRAAGFEHHLVKPAAIDALEAIIANVRIKGAALSAS